jgi:hypothetical protein
MPTFLESATILDRAIEDQDYGCRDFDERDPEGHVIGVGQELAKD